MPQAFERALDAYQAAAGQRSPATNDTIEDRVGALFWSMVKTPARTIENTVAKGRAMLGEYGETGELRTDLVELLLKDLATLN